MLTFVVGDYLAPAQRPHGSQLRGALQGSLKLGRTGAWLKEHATRPSGERSYSINVGSAERGTLLRDVRIFEFDADGQLRQPDRRRAGAWSDATAPGC